MLDSVKLDPGNSFLHVHFLSLAGSATCLAYGDLHFVTFDERHISFTGTCTYILAQTCDNSTGRRIKPERRGWGGVGRGWDDRIRVRLGEGAALDQGPLVSSGWAMHTHRGGAFKSHSPGERPLTVPTACSCGRVTITGKGTLA